jgi:hypothetical protein
MMSEKLHWSYMSAAKKVEQDDLFNVTFKNQEKMFTQERMKSRDQKLYMAMLIGNHYQGCVRIIFNTEDGETEIESRIWARTDKYIVLKGGTFIPINAVIDIIMEC